MIDTVGSAPGPPAPAPRPRADTLPSWRARWRAAPSTPSRPSRTSWRRSPRRSFARKGSCASRTAGSGSTWSAGAWTSLSASAARPRREPPRLLRPPPAGSRTSPACARRLRPALLSRASAPSPRRTPRRPTRMQLLGVTRPLRSATAGAPSERQTSGDPQASTRIRPDPAPVRSVLPGPRRSRAGATRRGASARSSGTATRSPPEVCASARGSGRRGTGLRRPVHEGRDVLEVLERPPGHDVGRGHLARGVEDGHRLPPRSRHRGGRPRPSRAGGPAGRSRSRPCTRAPRSPPSPPLRPC